MVDLVSCFLRFLFASLAVMFACPGLAGPEPLTLPIPVSDLPLGRGDTLALGLPGRNDKQATLAPVGEAGFVLVYQSGLGVDLDALGHFEARSMDGRHVSAPQPLRLVDQPVVASASLVSQASRTWLYFVVGETLEGPAEIWRAQLDATGFLPAERMPDLPELTRIMGWPHWVATQDAVHVSFRGKGNRPYFGTYAENGEASVQRLFDHAAAYVRVVPMTGGGWLLNFQTTRGGEPRMLTYGLISKDDARWGDEPFVISRPEPPAWADVHDAFALPRRDHGVDVYYCYPTPKQRIRANFNLYRRAVFADGRMGAEQLVTDVETFDPYSPSAHRLADGSVLLTFSSILEVEAGVGVKRAWA